MTAYVIATGSAESRAPALNAEQLLNCLVEREDAEAKTQAPLFLAPGLVAFKTCGAGPIRGIWIAQTATYVVSGAQLYQINVFGAVTLIGGGLPGTGMVSMADNGTQLCMVFGQDDGSGWIYNYALGGAITQITSVNYFPSGNVIFLDGYFLFNRTSTTEIFFSALFDGLTFSGTDFFNTESSSSPNVAIAANLQLLFFFKFDRIEMWYDSGAASNPFQRYAGGVLNYGIAGSFCIAVQDGAIFFLGSDGIIYRLQANVPIRVSTHPIETLISKNIGNLIATSAFTFTIEGHKLVCWYLPVTQQTIVFDVSSGKWHERESYSALGAPLGGWRVSCAVEGGNATANLGDRFSGQIWNPSFQTYTEGANPIYMSITSGVLASDRKWLTVNGFQIDCQTGVGNGAAPTPVATLYTSKDGTTFTSRGSKPIPADGAIDARMLWPGLGRSRQWTFRITLNDPVQRVLIGASFDVSKGLF